MANLNYAAYRDRSLMAASDLDGLEQQYPGFIGRCLAGTDAWICARLVKRYAVPFDTSTQTIELLNYEGSVWEDGAWSPAPVPFSPPRLVTHVTGPEVVAGWITALVDLAAYRKLGFNPGSAQDQTIIDAATTARTDVREAADSETGLFELPLRAATPDASGVVKGGPYGYSEHDPFTWTDLQAEVRYGR